MFKSLIKKESKATHTPDEKRVLLSCGHKRAKRRIRLSSLCIFIISFALLIVALASIEKSIFDHIQNDVIIQTQEQARLIQRQLTQSLSPVYALAALVKQSKGEVHDFEAFAAEFFPLYESVSSIQLAKDAIVSNIYPLRGNEKAIGHNLLQDKNRVVEATKAIKTKSLTLSGPYQLIQGGQSVIARYPIFFEEAEKEKFWGFSIVVINLDTLLNATSLTRLAEEGYDCEIFKKSPETQEDFVFYQNHEERLVNPYEYLFSVPNGAWHIAMKPHAGWINTGSIALKAMLILLGSFGLSLLAYSFLNKPLQIEQMVQNQTHMLNTANEELRKITSELEEIAHIDALTGVPNRRLFMETLHKTIQDYENEQGNVFFSLLYFDIDLFKSINDQLGHLAGDEVLKQLVSTLSENVRKTDTIGRLGGDEFVVLLTNLTDVEEAHKVAKKIGDLSSLPFTVNGQKVSLTVSIGIASYPADGRSAEALLCAADANMYHEKNHKNKVFPLSL